MKTELWREIPGYPNVLASNLGRVKRIYKNSEHLIKGSVNRHGYVVTTLYADGKHQQIHRLVALAWIDNPDRKPFIDHINGVRTDNHPDNLRWVTNKENMSFEPARRNLAEAAKICSPNILLKRKVYNRSNSEREICQLSMDGVLIRIHSSIANAARYLGNINNTSKITSVCKGSFQRNSAYGYRWCYYFGVDVGILSLLL